MWSKIVETDIGKTVIDTIMDNTAKLGLRYHNIRHVHSMYQFYERA